jgi:hypothetical protein
LDGFPDDADHLFATKHGSGSLEAQGLAAGLEAKVGDIGDGFRRGARVSSLDRVRDIGYIPVIHQRHPDLPEGFLLGLGVAEVDPGGLFGLAGHV